MQLVFRLNDTRRILEDDLVIFFGDDGFDTVPGCLHFRRNDGQLFACKGVQQGAFSGVGPSKNADES